MNIKTRIGAFVGGLGLVVGITVGVAGPAIAHNPHIVADCATGVHVFGDSYDGNKLNTWDINIGGTDHSGTFGNSVDQTFPLPQGGATTHVTASIADADHTAAYSDSIDKNIGPCGTVPATIGSTVTGQVTCDVTKQLYTIVWSGVVTGNFPGYVAERVKYTSVNPAVTVSDGVPPGTAYTYTTTAPGSATSASAVFHVHVTQTQAGVDPLDTDATGNVTLDGNCTPAAELCTVTGTPYTEDGFPLFTVDGQRYGNPDASQPAPGHALNWLVPVHGNLQGFTTASYTISSASGYQAAFRFVLLANGTSGYTSVTAEPYLNGWVAGQTGTFTITPATLVWNSHILSGPGSQGSPVSITAMAALIPNNELQSEGIHSGSTFAPGQYTTVSQITGCVSFNKPVAPDPIPSITTDNGEVLCSPTGGGSYIVTTHYFLTYPLFVAPSSFTFDGQLPVKSAEDTYQTIEVGTDVCPDLVTPEGPTTACNGVVTLPGVVDGSESETANAHYTVAITTSTITVTADPLDGFQFNAPGVGDKYTLSEGSAVWTIPNTVCPVKTPPTDLAMTGVDTTPIVVGGSSLLLLGIIAFGISQAVRMRRRHQ